MLYDKLGIVTTRYIKRCLGGWFPNKALPIKRLLLLIQFTFYWHWFYNFSFIQSFLTSYIHSFFLVNLYSFFISTFSLEDKITSIF
jgi:hypothetical protein